MVFHIHVGEGFPVLDKKAIFHERGHFDTDHPTCGMGNSRLLDLSIRVGTGPIHSMKALPVLPGNGAEPLHYENARRNLDALITAIEKLRGDDEFSNLDDHVRVRFGHATHATFEQALRMASAKIEVDINLGSNLSTQSIIRERASDMPYDTAGDDALLGEGVIGGTSFDEMAAVTSEVRWQGWEKQKGSVDTIAYVFRQHGLVPCLLAGVHTTLGTDGEGVEHTNLCGEYRTAHAILQAFVEWEPWLLDDPLAPSWALRYHMYVRELRVAHERELHDRGEESTALRLESVAVEKLLGYAQEHTAWMCSQPNSEAADLRRKP